MTIYSYIISCHISLSSIGYQLIRYYDMAWGMSRSHICDFANLHFWKFAFLHFCTLGIGTRPIIHCSNTRRLVSFQYQKIGLIPIPENWSHSNTRSYVGGSMAVYVYMTIRTALFSVTNSCECMGGNGEALQLRAVYKRHILYSRENPHQVLQVTCATSELSLVTSLLPCRKPSFFLHGEEPRYKAI